jgi:hypothetical protein
LRIIHCDNEQDFLSWLLVIEIYELLSLEVYMSFYNQVYNLLEPLSEGSINATRSGGNFTAAIYVNPIPI